ncbi:MAG: VanZ family protein [bacterium]
MSLIFFLSSRSTFPLSPPRIPYSDKICHCLEYAILGYLLMRAFIHEDNPRLFKNALLLAIGVAVLFGISDELHQLFVPLRQADVFDLVADSFGAAMGSWFALWMHWFTNNRQRKGHN